MRPEVGDDVAEQVVGDDHLELPGIEDHVHRQGVDVVVRGLDARILAATSEDPLPERMALLHGVALVGHADLRQPPGLRELEGVADDPVHALPGVEFLLDGDLVLGARP
jgi:hypothetical protein